MTINWETRVNSSYGSGVTVSLAGGKRQEKFLNTEEDWYLAQELCIVQGGNEIEIKFPGLGDLLMIKKSWTDDDFQLNVGQFPKGSWEYVRLIE